MKPLFVGDVTRIYSKTYSKTDTALPHPYYNMLRRLFEI